MGRNAATEPLDQRRFGISSLSNITSVSFYWLRASQYASTASPCPYPHPYPHPHTYPHLHLQPNPNLIPPSLSRFKIPIWICDPIVSRVNLIFAPEPPSPPRCLHPPTPLRPRPPPPFLVLYFMATLLVTGCVCPEIRNFKTVNPYSNSRNHLGVTDHCSLCHCLPPNPDPPTSIRAGLPRPVLDRDLCLRTQARQNR